MKQIKRSSYDQEKKIFNRFKSMYWIWCLVSVLSFLSGMYFYEGFYILFLVSLFGILESLMIATTSEILLELRRPKNKDGDRDF